MVPRYRHINIHLRFDWISNEKGQAMLAELDGLIVQRRLHKACTEYWTKSKYQVYKIIRRIQKVGFT